MMENSIVEILLVEDNANDAELAIRSLRNNNIANEIIHLSDGELALDFLFAKGVYSDRNTCEKPKVILLDLKMPKVSGIEVLEEIKAHPETKKIPVVVLTSSNEHPDVQKAYDLGANSYIVKPVDFDSFQRIVKNLGIYWLIHNESPS